MQYRFQFSFSKFLHYFLGINNIFLTHNDLHISNVNIHLIFFCHFIFIIAISLCLGEIQQRGMVLPFTPDIYRPILHRLKAEGVESFETSKWL